MVSAIPFLPRIYIVTKSNIVSVSFHRQLPEDDLAIVELEEPIKFDKYKSPARLADIGLSYEHEQFQVAGWGSTSATSTINGEKKKKLYSPELQVTTVNYVPTTECREQYSKEQNKNLKIMPGMICAGSGASTKTA